MNNKIQISKTAKYTTYGNPETATTVLFVLHGYGQLVDFFIRKFHVLDNQKYFVVAPEGLHRFYLKGSAGRVGASWMTKEERQSDIDDYVGYLDLLWKDLSSKYTFDKKIVLGFSQGGATAARWHSLGIYNADQFILWAAIFPPDMEHVINNSFSNSNNFLVFGTEDEYYTNDSIDTHFKTLQTNEMNFRKIKFEGNHNIHPETLLNLM